jgi:hypothetical protein
MPRVAEAGHDTLLNGAAAVDDDVVISLQSWTPSPSPSGPLAVSCPHHGRSASTAIDLTFSDSEYN